MQEWYAEVFSTLHMRNWEGEIFLYNPLTAHTHILNELGWFVLSACSEAAVPQDQLLEQLSEMVESPDREDLAGILGSHLDQLSQLGLLEGSETLAA